jgi:hypothetical protein
VRTLPRGQLHARFYATTQRLRVASIAATSIFFICIIASNARLATAGSGSVKAFVKTIGVIYQAFAGVPPQNLHSLIKNAPNALVVAMF